MLVDIGVNLTNNRFIDDLDSVVKQAFDAGVQQMIITGTSAEESEQALSIARSYPKQLFATAGCHPHDAKAFSPSDLQRLRALLSDERVVAVGECGLDFNRNFSPRETQIAVFRQQLELACETQKPLFLHERDAFAEQYQLLQEYWPQISGGVAHCFTGDKEALEAYLELGLYIGITGWICDTRRGQSLFELVSLIPDDRLLIETDAPFLLPHNTEPKPKSRRNVPAYLPFVAQRVAEARSQSVEHIAAITTANARRLFALPTPDSDAG